MIQSNDFPTEIFAAVWKLLGNNAFLIAASRSEICISILGNSISNPLLLVVDCNSHFNHRIEVQIKQKNYKKKYKSSLPLGHSRREWIISTIPSVIDILISLQRSKEGCLLYIRDCGNCSIHSESSWLWRNSIKKVALPPGRSWFHPSDDSPCVIMKQLTANKTKGI